MSFIVDFFDFVYGGVTEGPASIVVCVVKALALTMIFCLGSVASVYILITSAFVICCATILPIILISIFWKGFWGDLGYTYKWIWISGFIIGGCISCLLFLPVWLGIALALVVLVLIILCSIILGVAYLLYVICGSCYVYCSSCCKNSNKSSANCCNECGKCVGDCFSTNGSVLCCKGCIIMCASCKNRSSKPKIAPKPPDGLAPINKYTIIFDTTENYNLPPIDKNTIIFESTIVKD